MSPLGCLDSENKLQRQKQGHLGLRRKKDKKTHLEEGEGKGTGAVGRASLLGEEGGGERPRCALQRVQCPQGPLS